MVYSAFSTGDNKFYDQGELVEDFQQPSDCWNVGMRWQR